MLGTSTPSKLAARAKRAGTPADSKGRTTALRARRVRGITNLRPKNSVGGPSSGAGRWTRSHFWVLAVAFGQVAEQKRQCPVEDLPNVARRIRVSGLRRLGESSKGDRKPARRPCAFEAVEL